MSFSKRSKWSIALSLVGLAALLLGAVLYLQPGTRTNAAKAQPTGGPRLNKIQQRLLSGFLDSELNSNNGPTINSKPRNYRPSNDDGCSQSRGSNIKVNQNCLNLSDADLQGRGQSNNETSIAQDPLHPNRIIASYNDYRRGDGNCYTAYSLDQGANWIDTTVPTGFTRGAPFGAAREYWEAGGDTVVAWDTKGNAYLQCQLFQRGSPTTPNPDLSSAVYIFRSTRNAGASWNFPGRPVVENADTSGTSGILEDKPFMTVDNHIGSPYQDRIYVSWTEFAADGTAYIWESYSNDYGESFSPRVLVSSNSSLCGNNYGLPTPQGNCNENQFSQPFTGSDGALYVVWANFNNVVTGNDNRNQMLLAKSTNGGASFSAPVKVSDYYDLPDCLTYQGKDAGRACVPEKGSGTNSYFRAANYPSGAVNPKNPNQVVVTFGSYINVYSNESNGCVPNGLNPATGDNLFTGVKTPGACNNDILESVSNDAGASFTGTTTDPRSLTSVTSAAAQTTTDQWWQWIGFTSTGRLAVSYYDRQYGTDERSGFSDVSLSGSSDLTHFNVARVTSSSMPPPTQFGGLFYGDYTGLTVFNQTAHPSWMDTRDKELFLCPGTGIPGVPPALCTAAAANAAVANDQEAFTASVIVP